LKELLGKCCTKFQLGCDVGVEATYDDRNNGISVNIQSGELPSLPGLTAYASHGSITWTMDGAQSDIILAHETGHVAGYREPKNRDPKHSGDPSNIMFNEDGPRGKVDKCWCEKVSGLAK
jgi:hypothetical protein